MYIKSAHLPEDTCECCGGPVQAGDLVYDSGEIYIHDACFFDYIRKDMLESGWRHYVYGDEEMD